MKKTLYVVIVLLISVASFAQRATIVESSEHGITLKMTLDDYRFDEVTTPNGTAYVPIISKHGNNTEKGAPDLPSVIESLLIPDRGGVEVNVLSSSYETLYDIAIAPSKGVIYRNETPEDVPYIYGDVYRTDRFLPEALCSAGEPYIMRDVRGINVEFNPFVYNAVSKELRVYKEMVVEVRYNNAESKNEIDAAGKSRKKNEEFENIYKRLFLNAPGDAKYTILEELSAGKLLIIVNDIYADAMLDYVKWKREKGMETEMVLASSISDQLTSALLKEFIQEKYDNEENLCYILLVGDGADIPTRIRSGYGDSDYYYACLAGSDGYADAFIGRFSGNTIEDIQTQVERTIHYEKYLDSTDTWLGNAFGSASREGAGQGHNNESDVQHINIIRTALEGYGYEVTHVYESGGNNSMISEAFNKGVGVANYIGHGDVTMWVNTYYTNTQVKALENEYMLPFIWSVACQNGNFRNTTCFAEAWLRATNNGNPTGAIAFMGSTIDQSWKEPMDAQDEMVEILVESYPDNIKRTIGGLSFNGVFKMIQNGGLGQQMADTWVLFGDPSLMVRTKTPSAMEINHDDEIRLGLDEFVIECETEGALACLSSEDEDGNVEIISSAYVIDGIATLPVNPQEPTAYLLTMTAFDKETIRKEMPIVVAEGAYIVKDGFAIDDSTGNADGRIDYGERIVITQSLKNVGVEKARNLTLTLSVDNEAIEIVKDSEVIAEIEAHSSVDVANAFILDIPNNIEDRTPITFYLTISDTEGNVWNTSYMIEAYAPQIDISSARFDDRLSGNGNMLMDDGEEATLTFTLSNKGSSAFNGNVILSTDCDFVMIEGNSVELPDVEAGGNATIEFGVKLNEEIPSEIEEACLSLYLVSVEDSRSVCFLVNLPIENWESDSFSAHAWDNSSDIPWAIDSAEKYEGDYSVKTGAIPNKGNTALVITLDVIEDGAIEFYKKVSCEKTTTSSSGVVKYYDSLTFFIDDEPVGRWGGEIDWSLESFDVEAGIHEFKWQYAKDTSLSEGQDCAWVDFIRFPKINQSSVNMTLPDINALRIYPNPSGGQFRVETSAPAQMRIIDLTGRQMYESELKGGVNNVSVALPDGIYTVVVSTKDSISSSKMIIKK